MLVNGTKRINRKGNKTEFSGGKRKGRRRRRRKKKSDETKQNSILGFNLIEGKFPYNISSFVSHNKVENLYFKTVSHKVRKSDPGLYGEII